jgi:CRP-like cAMP-binding protein
MDKQALIQYIQTSIQMPTDIATQIAEKFEHIEVAKNDFLHLENKPCNYTYILQMGYVRSFVHDGDGQEVTVHIYRPFTIVNDALAFFKRQPVTENIQALTDCDMWRMSYEDVQTNFHGIPQFREFGRMMLITNLATMKQRTLTMIKDSAEVRYKNLLEQHPEIFMNVPLKIIASYLGITDTSLSRIRKELTHK